MSDFLSRNKFDFVLAIGDDSTDEDMFGRLNEPHQLTVRVGLKSTNAMYNLIGVSNVYSLLEQLCSFRRSTLKAI